MDKLIRITTIPLSLEKLLGDQLKYMRGYYAVTAVSSNEPRLKQVGKKEGVPTYTVEMTRQITPIADLKALWKLYNFLRKEKPLIVHSHTPKAGIVGMMAAKLAGVPIRLHTVAGLPLMEVTGNRRKLLNLVEKLTYSCATNVYPNSHGLKEIILNEDFCRASKLKVIANGSSNGINTSYFSSVNFQLEELGQLKASLSIVEFDTVFVFVGRLVSDKGVNELISSFKNLNKKHPQTKLLLVGPLEEELDPLDLETLTEIDNNDNIISLGYQTDVRPYFAISDALAFPSYREGFPNVVMQAGAMGLPSIVSNINGCNEIIVEGENGIIIPPKDSDALYHAMLKFVEDKDLLSKLKANARRMIVERYEQQVVWDALLAEYKRLEENVQKRN